MNNLKIIIFLLTILIFINNEVLANEEKSIELISNGEQNYISSLKQSEVELNINNDNKLKINVTEPIKQIDGQLFKSKEEMMSQYFQVQKKMDIADIKVLWESTIDRNPIIKFALKKLAMRRTKKSSFINNGQNRRNFN